MKDYLRETSRQSASMAVIYIIIGLVMCIFSSSILTTLIRVIGGGLIIYGAWQLYMYFGKDRRKNNASLFYGIPSIIAGAVLIFQPWLLIHFFTIIVGAIMVLNGIFQVQRSVMLKDAGFSGWVFNTVISVILLACGVFLIFNPVSTVHWMFQMGGIFLIIEGVFMIWQSFETRKYLTAEPKTNMKK